MMGVEAVAIPFLKRKRPQKIAGQKRNKFASGGTVVTLPKSPMVAFTDASSNRYLK
jgi:hypothetical protein